MRSNSAFEDFLGEIALGGIGDDCDYARPCSFNCIAGGDFCWSFGDDAGLCGSVAELGGELRERERTVSKYG